MSRALDLAQKGFGFVSPNPMVGCVIVKDDKIIGEGYHENYGGLHAEPNAVAKVNNKEDIKLADVYVTLEPCAHYGKTPPCADLLASLKPKRVIIAVIDDNPLVGGKGVKILEEAGIEVIIGVLEKEARLINKRFFTFMQKQRPYIILKWAQTADGFVARKNFDSKWITGIESRTYVHQMRAEEDSIMVGFNTAKYDNPSLTTRLVQGKNPLRIFIDKRLELESNSNLLDQSTPTICYNYKKSENHLNLLFVKLDETKDFMEQVFNDLFNRKVSSIIVEGGSTLLTSLIQANLWDEACVFTSKNTFEDGIKAPEISTNSTEIKLMEKDKLELFINI